MAHTGAEVVVEGFKEGSKMLGTMTSSLAYQLVSAGLERRLSWRYLN